MTSFPINTLDSAPEKSKPAMQNLQAAFGTLPNIIGAISTSPVLLDSLAGLFQQVHGGSFSEPEVQILLLTNAVTNASSWAVAFHSLLALEQGISAEDVERIRQGSLPKDAKFAALSKLAKTLIEKRGHLADADLDGFLKAGFTRDLALEVIAAVSASTITNYTGNVTLPPLEAAFQAHRWAKEENLE